MAVTLKRVHRPSRLSVIVKAPDGSPITRWAQDEPKLENVFSGLTFSGEMPGGHKELTLRLARDPKRSYRDLALFNRIEVWTSDGERVWCGTIRQEPTSDGDQQSIEVKAAGDMQFLEDDSTIVGPGFIDRRLERWAGPSAQRKLNIDSTFDVSASPSVESDPTNGVPVISLTSTGPMNRTYWQALYDGGGVPIGQVTCEVLPKNLLPHSSDANVNAHFFSVDDDLFTNPTELPDVSVSGLVSMEIANRRAVAFEAYYGGVEVGEAGTEYGFRLRELMVFSAEGVAAGILGTWPNHGFLAAQMIPFIVAGSPLTTKAELLEDDGFVIPQAWFDAPGTRMSKLVEVTKYGLLDWFVFGDRILQYRFPGTYGRTWRLGPGNGPKNSGADATQVFDRLMVSYQDVDGTTKYTDLLTTTDPSNPAAAAGVPRGKLLALNGVCTEELALEVRQRAFEELQNLSQSGEVTLTDHVQDEASGAWYPVSYVQPGDRVREQSNGHERKVTSTSYTDESVSNALTIGAPPNGEKAIEERFNARLIELGLGG